MRKIIKTILFPTPKFRIICRNQKFVPQEFSGIWKVGIYADIAKSFSNSEVMLYQFEHENIAEAELVLERRIRQLKKKKFYIVKFSEA